MRPGRIVFLNGTSSSGKSSIATELLATLDPPHFLLAVDEFNSMRSRERTQGLAPDELSDVLRRTRLGFHRAIAGLAAGGNDVIVDHILSEPWRLLDCLEVLAEYDVTLVGVHCPLPELIRRERLRGDRPSGLAEQQFAQVHSHNDYDVEVDTASYSAAECAEQIRAYLARPHSDNAFTRLRRNLT